MIIEFILSIILLAPAPKEVREPSIEDIKVGLVFNTWNYHVRITAVHEDGNVEVESVRFPGTSNSIISKKDVLKMLKELNSNRIKLGYSPIEEKK